MKVEKITEILYFCDDPEQPNNVAWAYKPKKGFTMQGSCFPRDFERDPDSDFIISPERLKELKEVPIVLR